MLHSSSGAGRVARHRRPEQLDATASVLGRPDHHRQDGERTAHAALQKWQLHLERVLGPVGRVVADDVPFLDELKATGASTATGPNGVSHVSPSARRSPRSG